MNEEDEEHEYLKEIIKFIISLFTIILSILFFLFIIKICILEIFDKTHEKRNISSALNSCEGDIIIIGKSKRIINNKNDTIYKFIFKDEKNEFYEVKDIYDYGISKNDTIKKRKKL